MALDYFYGQAGELFSFYRIPKALFQEPRFQSLSTDAKTLYGILLDRMSLSMKNGWLDEQNRVFIIFTMQRTVESVEQYGVLSPLIARPRPEGGYEIISGHRRQHAAQLAGLDTLPVIVRQMDDDAAVLLMVDSNLQRETILPSERAFAYKMKLEAMKHQAGRPTQDNYSQVGNNFGTLSSEEMAEELGTSKNQIFRYIRLTNLVPELLDMVDEKKIAFNPAVELSYLDESQQRDFLEAMNDTQNAPSLSQAQRLKKLAQEGHFSYDVAFAVMGEEKKDELDKVVIKNDTLRKYFPRSYTPKQMEDTIIKLLEQWQRKQQRQNER